MKQSSLLCSEPSDADRAQVEAVMARSSDLVTALVALAALRAANPARYPWQRFEAFVRVTFPDGPVIVEALRSLRRPIAQPQKQTPGAHRIKEILSQFDVAWARKYGQPYLRTNAAAEAKAAKLLTGEPLARVTAWVGHYLVSTKPWLVEARHPFLRFIATINEWRVAAPSESTRAVPGADETAAYRRRMREGR